MAFNRELSQFAAYLELDAAGKYIGITPAESSTNVGIGVTNPDSKLSVVGDANITGVVTATQFYGDLDYSYVLNATAGVRTEFSVVDNGGDGSLSYDSQTGIISYIGPSSAEARAHFSATSSDLGSFSYSAETGVFAYTGVTTGTIRDQFSSSSADIGSLSYDSQSGQFSLAGVTTSAIRDQFSSSSADIGSLSYNAETGTFSLAGVTTSTIRDQFSASSADIGSLSYNAETGEIALSGVTTSSIRNQFSASSADIGTLTYNSTTGEIALAGVTTSSIRNQFTGGTGVSITDGEIAIGQPVGTNDSVTFAAVNSTGIVTATEFVTGAEGDAIHVKSDRITGPSTIVIDPSGIGDNTGVVVIKGDLQVDGETTTINSTTVTIVDKNIQIADGSVNDAAADGAGFTVNSDDGNKTFQFNDASGAFKANISIDVASGEVYKINGTEVLSSTTLGSGVTSSSLTSVGTLTKLDVGNVNSTGIVTATSFSGNLTGNVTGDLTGNADTATALETSRDFSVSGDVATASAVSFDGTGNVDLSVTLSNNFSANTSGIVTATGGFVGDLTGNADTATALETGRDFSISGDAEASTITFDGTSNVGLALTLANTAVVAGSYGSASEIPTFTVDSKGRLTAAGIATVSTDLEVAGDSGSETISLLNETLTIAGGTNLTSSAASNTVTVNLDDNISLTSVSASGVITATSGFSGDLTGNVTGNVTGDLTGEVNAVAFDTNADGVVVTGIATATGFSGDLTGNVTGNVTGDVTGEVNAVAFDTNADGVVVTGIATATGFSGNLTGDVTGDLTGEVNAVAFDTNESGVVVTGVTTSTSGFVGDLTGNVTGNVTGDLTGEVNAAAFDTNESGVVVTGIATATGFVGDLTGNVTGDLTGEVNAVAFDTNADGVVVTGIATATGFSGNLTGNVTGNADTATALQTGRTISLSGDLIGEVVFDGTANVSIAATIQPDSVALGTDTTGDYVESVADSGSADIVVSGSGESAAVTLGLTTTGVTAGSYGSGSEIPTFTVDSRGRLTAAGTVSVSTGMTVAGDSGSEVIDLLTDTLTIAGGTNLTSSAASDTVTINLDDNISLTSVVASGIITAAEFVTGASGQAIGINTDTISGPSTLIIDPAAVGDNTGVVVIKGDLQIDGETTTINSTELIVDDKNITLGSGAINDAAADGGGITLESGEGNKTWNWVDATDSWTSSEHIDAVSGKVYKINGTEVLSSDTLGSGIVNSSLTSVGTLGNLNVSGVTTSTSGFVGDLTGNVTGNVTGDLTGEVNAAAFDTNESGVVVTGVTTSTSGFVGDLTGNADTATALETGRDFSISGDAEASSITFDGTANVGLALTLANTAVVAGSYGSGSEIPTFTVDGKGRLTAAGTVAVSTGMTVAGDSGSEDINLLTDTLTIAGGTNLTSSAASDTVTINLDDNISLTSVSASGIITATGFSGNLTGDVTGNADTATALETGRDFSISGDAEASAITFDGTANVGLALTLANTAVTAGSYGSATEIPTFTVDGKGRLTAAGIATVSTDLNIAGDSGSDVISLLTDTLTVAGGTNLTSSAASDTVTINLDDNISLTSVVASGIITAAEFVGDLTGNVTGNLNSSGVSTVTNLVIDGYVSAGSTTGEQDQVLVSVGTGVTWVSIGDVLPTARTGLTTSATAAQTTFSFEYNVGFLDVFVNGVKLSASEFTALNGNDIILGEPAFDGDNVEFVSYATIALGSGEVNSLNDLTDVELTAPVLGNLLAYDGLGWSETSELKGITALDATTTATIETAIANAPNDFTSLNISGFSTFQGGALVGAATTFTEDLVVEGDARVTGILTVGTSSLTLDGINDRITVGTELTLSSSGIVAGVITATSFVGDGSGLTGAGSTVADDTTTDETFYPVFTSTTSGTITASKVSTTKLSFNPSTGTLNATELNSTSDINLKKDISPVENALETVQKLEGVNFTWKDNDKQTIGVIAQQIEEHLPQLVDTAEHKSVNYNGLIGVLIEAVKEQQSQIEVLKAEIEELKK